MPKFIEPTVADLVVLAVLTEGPLHGYALNVELTKRAVEDWGPVSRPQVYYSLKKLETEGWIETTDAASSLGPDRRSFCVTPAGRRALEESLARPVWAEGHLRFRFTTWLVLSPFASVEARRMMVEERERWLRAFIAEESLHLRTAEAHESAMAPMGALLIRHKIRLAEVEVEWLEEVRRSALE